MANEKIFSKVILLIIVFIFIGYLLFIGNYLNYDFNNQNINNNSKNTENYKSTSFVHKEIKTSSDVGKNTNTRKTIVTDKFASRIDKDSTLIVVKDSNIYTIEKGIILIDETLIKKNEEEVIVDYLASPRRRIDSN
ncbi:MAG: hypothetical protein ACOC16_02630 [Nanoarchaeota archaeon]